MILNSKNNNFIFRYPKDFLRKEIQEKYNTYLSTQPTPFKNCMEYLNATIQKVSLPTLNIQNIEQAQTQQRFKDINRGGQIFSHYLTREISVTHKHTEGFLSYFMLWENTLSYVDYQNSVKFLPNLEIIMLNNEFQETFRYNFKNLVISSFSENFEMDYTSVRNIPKTFTIKYSYNELETIFKIDGKETKY